MPRKPHKYHFIYKTTNLVNGKWYMGMHSTSNLEDGYVGSGTFLWKSIKKYGRENFKMEIQEFFPDRRSLKEREIEIITEELLEDPMCMNLSLGGNGGPFINDETWKKIHSLGGIATMKLLVKRHCERLKNDTDYRNKFCKSQQNRKGGRGAFVGKHHSDETIKKIKEKNSVAAKGENNSQFGRKWIYNIDVQKSIAVKQSELNEYLDKGWKLGRKRYK